MGPGHVGNGIGDMWGCEGGDAGHNICYMRTYITVYMYRGCDAGEAGTLDCKNG